MKAIAGAIVVLSGAVIVAGGAICAGAAAPSTNYKMEAFGQYVAMGGIVLIVLGMIAFVGAFFSGSSNAPE